MYLVFSTKYDCINNARLKRHSLIYRILISLAVYFGLLYYGGDIGRTILYPIRLLVTFLHELGHAIAAVLTGGHVDKLQINPDGSGWTRTAGGMRSLVIMGGYIGSAVFGNILFYMGVKWRKAVVPVLYLLAGSMIFTALFWFNSLFTSLVLILFSMFLIWMTGKKNMARELLMFLGLICTIYIIQDFNIGPGSDLKAYAREMIIFPVAVWKYIWLAIVLLLFIFNLKTLLKTS